MRNPEYQFVSTDTSSLVEEMTAEYARLTGETIAPGSPESLMIRWVASIIVQMHVKLNVAANQNLPSRAEGDNLDALAQLFYAAERPEAQPAVCIVRFQISQAQTTSVLIPAGTRVTDGGQTLYWATMADAYIPIGATYADVRVQCQTPGTVGNDWQPGSINTIVDLYDYYSGCGNITVSDSGSERLEDDAFYEILRASLDGMSTAGARGNYIYHAKAVSSEIADVVVNSPAPGEVRLYILTADGEKASETLKQSVYEACNADSVRPLTDYVVVGDPEEVEYDISLTYYVPSDAAQSSADLEAAVQTALEEYKLWQSGKLGRDINPSKLISMLMSTGIKRVHLRSPAFTKLRDGNLYLESEGETPALSETIPQLAKVRNVTITNGGVEDE